MTLSAFFLIITGVLLNAVAQLALKASVNDMGAISVGLNTAIPVFTRLAAEPWLWVGLACYGISVIVYFHDAFISEYKAHSLMLSIGYVVNAMAAWALLGEALTGQRVLGIGIIIIGVVVLTRS